MDVAHGGGRGGNLGGSLLCCRRAAPPTPPRLSLSLSRARAPTNAPPSRLGTKPTNQTKQTVEPLFQALCDNSALNPDTDAEEQVDNTLIFDRLEALAGAELARHHQEAGAGGENGAAGEEMR